MGASYSSVGVSSVLNRCEHLLLELPEPPERQHGFVAGSFFRKKHQSIGGIQLTNLMTVVVSSQAQQGSELEVLSVLNVRVPDFC